MSRIEWLKLLMRYGNPKNRGRQVLFLLVFEIYYQLCKLRGYKPRHIMDSSPEAVRGMRAGDRILLIWPYLPLSIRLLDRIFPYGKVAHAEYLPYTPEALAAAR